MLCQGVSSISITGDNSSNIHEEILILLYQDDLQECKCMKVKVLWIKIFKSQKFQNGGRNAYLTFSISTFFFLLLFLFFRGWVSFT